MSDLERIEQLKHFEDLLSNCISYLWEDFSFKDCDCEECFKNLGFTKEDMDYWSISEEED